MRHTDKAREQLIEIVRETRCRIIVDRALWEGVLAATVAMLGPTLRILLGRNLFPWPMLVVFALGSVGIASLRIRQQSPDLYRAAQILDARNWSEDQIATAIHFLDSEEPAAVLQRQECAVLIGRIDLKSVFPFTLPRSLYGLCAILLAALTLLALRYSLVPTRMDGPLPPVVLEALLGRHEIREEGFEERESAKEAPAKDVGLAGLSAPAGSSGMAFGNRSDAGSEGDMSASEGESATGEEGATREQAAGSDEPRSSSDANYQDEVMQAKRGSSSGNEASASQNSSGRQGSDPAASQSGTRNDNSSSNLMGRLREAMKDLLSRMQQGLKGSNTPQAAVHQSPGGEEKNGAADRQNEPGGAEAVRQEIVDAEAGQAAARPSQNTGEGSGERKMDQIPSGAPGKEEGTKHLTAGKQQAAMGKLSELYGQRAEQVTGAVTVEAQAGAQTLGTPESRKRARHGEAGGEVSRDEIPFAYQAYIADYFHELHGGPEARASQRGR